MAGGMKRGRLYGGTKRRKAGVRNKGVLAEFRKEPRAVGGPPTESPYIRCVRQRDGRVKKRYLTLADAERVADIHSVSYGNPMEAYACECGFYHIGRPLKGAAQGVYDDDYDGRAVSGGDGG